MATRGRADAEGGAGPESDRDDGGGQEEAEDREFEDQEGLEQDGEGTADAVRRGEWLEKEKDVKEEFEGFAKGMKMYMEELETLGVLDG